MAAPVHNSGCWSTHKIYKHHEQQKVCISRAKYRDGRRDKAVKVYTINLESRYLMVQGVPAIGVMTELIQLCALYGVVEEYRPLDEYPAEEFTEVYLVKFQKLTSARAAKRHMDEKSFYGGVLHVCYVPEYETLEDTRLKLQDRRRYVIRTVQNKAREKEKEAEEVKEKSTLPHTLQTSEKTSSTNDESSASNNTAGTYSTGHYFGFPLLPLPPQEDYPSKYYTTYNMPLLPDRTMPREDKMGSLHNVTTDTQQKAIPHSQSSQTSCKTDRKGRVNPNPADAMRFVPRTTQLENRKRKMKEANGQLLFDNMEKTEPLIGPKLPEPPKLDMEDTSLNTTVNLIRNTMKKVAVPEVKPVEKKVKPRRRI